MTADATPPHAAQLDQLIPPDRRRAVEHALRAAFGDAPVSGLATLTGGASGAKIFRVEAAGEAWLLRLESNVGGLRDPVRQYACMGTAAQAGVAPRVLYASPDDGVAITDFVRSSPLTDEERRVRLPALARAVAVLHRTPLFPRFMELFDAMDVLLGNVGASGVLPPAARERLMRGHRAIAAVYPRGDTELVSSHNDLNPTNVLFEGMRPWLMDWEAAFANDRYVDVAALLNFFAPTPEDEETALRAYFGEAPSGVERARAFLMRQVNRSYYGAMMLQLAVLATPGFRLVESDLDTPSFREARAAMPPRSGADGRISVACVFLRDAMHDMESARFAQSIALVRG